MNNWANFADFTTRYPLLVFSLALWMLIWKSLAVWQAARRGRPVWFLVLLLSNTLGLLEMIYLFLVEKKRWRNLAE